MTSVGVELRNSLLVVEGAVVLAVLLCWRFDLRAAVCARAESEREREEYV